MRVVLQEVRKTHTLPGGGLVTVLDGISLALETRDRCLIFGPSGSGKTTLMNIIGGIARPTAGRIFRDGRELPGKGTLHPSQISHAFQEPVFVPELTVMENLLLPALGESDRAIVGRGGQLLEEFGLAEKFDLFPRDLSGGEKHRLNLARALLFPPRLLLLDSQPPCQDSAWGEKGMEVIQREVRDGGITLVMTADTILPGTEDFRRIRMNKGKVSEDGT